MRRCIECGRALTLDDAFGHDCEVSTTEQVDHRPSNLDIWRKVVSLAEALAIAERSSREVFAIDYADAELARMALEAEARAADRRTLQSLTNLIVLGNG